MKDIIVFLDGEKVLDGFVDRKQNFLLSIVFARADVKKVEKTKIVYFFMRMEMGQKDPDLLRDRLSVAIIFAPYDIL